MKAWAPIAILLLAACSRSATWGHQDGRGADGGVPEGIDPATGGPTLEAFLSVLDGVPRDHARKCAFAGEPDPWPSGFALDAEARLAGVAAEVAAGRLVYRSQHGRACLDALASARCALGLSVAGEACRAALVPATAAGAACHQVPLPFFEGIFSECIDGVCADLCPGTCRRLVPLGAACESRDRCVEGARCSAGTCVPLSGLGEDCAAGCAPGLRCEDGIYCRRLQADGTPCEKDEACESGLCQDGRCVPGSRLDGSCANNGHCPQGALCMSSQWTGEGLCRVPASAEAGDDCVHDLECREGLRCVPHHAGLPDGGVCERRPAPLGVGQPCRDEEDCVPEAWCRDYVCEARTPPGEPCSAAGRCFDGLICRSDAQTCGPRSAYGEACGSDSDCGNYARCEQGACRWHVCYPAP